MQIKRRVAKKHPNKGRQNDGCSSVYEQNYPVNQVLDYVDLKPSSLLQEGRRIKGKVKAPLLLNKNGTFEKNEMSSISD
ncbi:MAG: hypothetical protein U0T81_08960 [Saprospiraceae bacterium]